MIIAHLHPSGGDAPEALFKVDLIPGSKADFTRAGHGKHQQLKAKLYDGVSGVFFYSTEKLRHHAHRQTALVVCRRQCFQGVDNSGCRVVLGNAFGDGESEDLLDVGAALAGCFSDAIAMADM